MTTIYSAVKKYSHILASALVNKMIKNVSPRGGWGEMTWSALGSFINFFFFRGQNATIKGSMQDLVAIAHGYKCMITCNLNDWTRQLGRYGFCRCMKLDFQLSGFVRNPSLFGPLYSL